MDQKYVTVAEARQMLGYSRDKMTRRIKMGEITAIRNPHDERQKLILRVDVEKLLEQGRKR